MRIAVSAAPQRWTNMTHQQKLEHLPIAIAHSLREKMDKRAIAEVISAFSKSLHFLFARSLLWV